LIRRKTQTPKTNNTNKTTQKITITGKETPPENETAQKLQEEDIILYADGSNLFIPPETTEQTITDTKLLPDDENETTDHTMGKRKATHKEGKNETNKKSPIPVQPNTKWPYRNIFG